MKIYFGLYHRYEVGFVQLTTSKYMKKYGILFEEPRMPVSDDVCASCVGCIAFDTKIKRFLCVPFATEVDEFDAESQDIPCSKYKRMSFKKL